MRQISSSSVIRSNEVVVNHLSVISLFFFFSSLIPVVIISNFSRFLMCVINDYMINFSTSRYHYFSVSSTRIVFRIISCEYRCHYPGICSVRREFVFSIPHHIPAQLILELFCQ